VKFWKWLKGLIITWERRLFVVSGIGIAEENLQSTQGERCVWGTDGDDDGDGDGRSTTKFDCSAG
jgi:hypothetical protein